MHFELSFRWPCRSVELLAFASVVALGLTSGLTLATDAAAAAPKKGSRTAPQTAAMSPIINLATPKPLAPMATPLITVISIGEQRVSVWAGEQQVARSGVSTGMSGHRTPTGIFSVIGKERYHESNLYSDAPMPYMQRITWSGIALHEGNLPGYPASHGCIRLAGDFAQRLFGMSRMGMRVIVTDRDVVPTAVSHAALPAPTFARTTQVASIAEQPAGRMKLGATSEEIGSRLLNPMERGRLSQGRAKAHALEADADARALLDIANTRGEEARAAVTAERAAEAALRAVASGRAAAEAGLSGGGLGRGGLSAGGLDETARTRLTAQLASLETAHATALRKHELARAEASATDAAAFHAAGEAKAAVAERDAAEQAARVAERATEPVSIFVSRKERRVFVRQGFEPVFEADIEIADPQSPLGTHVFTAIAPPEDAGQSGGDMKWVAMTLQGQARVDTAAAPRGAKTLVADVRGTAVPTAAAAALDRIKFSDDVLEAISARLWTGASLIVSDHGISNETGKGTDFVVLTK